MRRAEATVVVSAAAVAGEPGGVAELWVRGDRATTLDALLSEGIGFREVRSASEVADGAAFRTVTWTFGFLRSLGGIAAALVVAAVFVHLDARHRERLLAHAFVRRMGLSERRHRRALVIELGASVVVGAWTGLVVAQVAAWTAHRHMDPVPRYDPAPVLRLDSWVILGSAAIAVALAVVGAGLAQRRMERGDPVEVLRAGA